MQINNYSNVRAQRRFLGFGIGWKLRHLSVFLCGRFAIFPLLFWDNEKIFFSLFAHFQKIFSCWAQRLAHNLGIINWSSGTTLSYLLLLCGNQYFLLSNQLPSYLFFCLSLSLNEPSLSINNPNIRGGPTFEWIIICLRTASLSYHRQRQWHKGMPRAWLSYPCYCAKFYYFSLLIYLSIISFLNSDQSSIVSAYAALYNFRPESESWVMKADGYSRVGIIDCNVSRFVWFFSWSSIFASSTKV